MFRVKDNSRGRNIFENGDKAWGLSLAGWLHWQKVIIGVSEDRAEDLRLARALPMQALEIRESGHFYQQIANLDIVERKHDDAIANARRAVERGQ